MAKKLAAFIACGILFSGATTQAEPISDTRLKELLSASETNAQTLETLRSRDRKILEDLGSALSQKYGKLLSGSEMIFTRLVEDGIVYYRMDFLNLKNVDYAQALCEILEVERCVSIGPQEQMTILDIHNDRVVSITGVVEDVRPFEYQVQDISMPEANPSARDIEARLRAKLDPLGVFPLRRPPSVGASLAPKGADTRIMETAGPRPRPPHLGLDKIDTRGPKPRPERIGQPQASTPPAPEAAPVAATQAPADEDIIYVEDGEEVAASGAQDDTLPTAAPTAAQGEAEDPMPADAQAHAPEIQAEADVSAEGPAEPEVTPPAPQAAPEAPSAMSEPIAPLSAPKEECGEPEACMPTAPSADTLPDRPQDAPAAVAPVDDKRQSSYLGDTTPPAKFNLATIEVQEEIAPAGLFGPGTEGSPRTAEKHALSRAPMSMVSGASAGFVEIAANDGAAFLALSNDGNVGLNLPSARADLKASTSSVIVSVPGIGRVDAGKLREKIGSSPSAAPSPRVEPAREPAQTAPRQPAEIEAPLQVVQPASISAPAIAEPMARVDVPMPEIELDYITLAPVAPRTRAGALERIAAYEQEQQRRAFETWIASLPAHDSAVPNPRNADQLEIVVAQAREDRALEARRRAEVRIARAQAAEREEARLEAERIARAEAQAEAERKARERARAQEERRAEQLRLAQITMEAEERARIADEASTRPGAMIVSEVIVEHVPTRDEILDINPIMPEPADAYLLDEADRVDHIAARKRLEDSEPGAENRFETTLGIVVFDDRFAQPATIDFSDGRDGGRLQKLPRPRPNLAGMVRGENLRAEIDARHRILMDAIKSGEVSVDVAQVPGGLKAQPDQEPKAPQSRLDELMETQLDEIPFGSEQAAPTPDMAPEPDTQDEPFSATAIFGDLTPGETATAPAAEDKGATELRQPTGSRPGVAPARTPQAPETSPEPVEPSAPATSAADEEKDDRQSVLEIMQQIQQGSQNNDAPKRPSVPQPSLKPDEQATQTSQAPVQELAPEKPAPRVETKPAAETPTAKPAQTRTEPAFTERKANHAERQPIVRPQTPAEQVVQDMQGARQHARLVMGQPAARPAERSSSTYNAADLRIELSYVGGRDLVRPRVSELKGYFPPVILSHGRFYGAMMPGQPGRFIVGIEAHDYASRDALIRYLEQNQIPWAIR